ncbi:hypothetical protein BXY39_1659 [Eilatimonas milleporae]|uniref:Uncharacterized protein n=1 Tax=Eilatimonas milleporae TaxID=911205 RepID=A0A3M0CI62_9PROT|nr:hypothetical protein BXY39_1659 [Eilatimonas milleporae]
MNLSIKTCLRILITYLVIYSLIYLGLVYFLNTGLSYYAIILMVILHSTLDIISKNRKITKADEN